MSFMNKNSKNLQDYVNNKGKIVPKPKADAFKMAKVVFKNKVSDIKSAKTPDDRCAKPGCNRKVDKKSELCLKHGPRY